MPLSNIKNFQPHYPRIYFTEEDRESIEVDDDMVILRDRELMKQQEGKKALAVFVDEEDEKDQERLDHLMKQAGFEEMNDTPALAQKQEMFDIRIWREDTEEI